MRPLHPDARMDARMTERFSYPLHFKFAGPGADEGVFTGLASTWGGPPDAYGDIVARGAFEKSLKSRWPAMLFAHSQAQPIGKWTEIVEDSKGLRVSGKINLETTQGREVLSMLKHGDVGSLSIGYNLAPGGITQNADGTATIKEVELFEISVVAIPANSRAVITGVKSFNSRPELESLLREAGLPSRAVKKLVAGGWPLLSDSEPEDQSPELDQLARRIDAARLAIRGI